MMNANTSIKETKLKMLETWAAQHSVEMEKLGNIKAMVNSGSRGIRKPNDPIQFPDFYYPDNLARDFHNPEDYAWTKDLENAYPTIKNEALNIFNDNLLSEHPQNNELANNGTWKTFFFYKNGVKFEENMVLCPNTAAVIDNIPGTSRAGRVYFSAMTPGTHVTPHCGPHNFKLRCHLGLVTAPEAVIRVGNTIKCWQDGRCLVFDDSFEHEVWNRSTLTRIVLIVDVWNPVLTPEEIKALIHIGIPTA